MFSAEKVRATIASVAHVPVEKVSDASRITEDLGLRSLQRTELAVLLEVELGSKVDDATVYRAKTVSDLLAALAPH